jgi:hypothetical protein
MTTTPDPADMEQPATAAVATTPEADEVPDWLAAMRPAPPVAPESGAPPAASAPRAAATPAGRPSEPLPALLADDDLPAWLTRLSTDAPAVPAPTAPPAGSVPAWVAPVGAAPAQPVAVAPDGPPPVWGARETTVAPAEEAGAAIFVSLASAPVTIEPEAPAVTTPAPATGRAIPWWWFAVAAALVLLLVVVLVLLSR